MFEDVDIKVISRKDAASKNLLTYFTGISGKCEHLSARYVSDGSCVACRRELNLNMQEGRVIDLITWTAARKSRGAQYFDEKPCRHGHLSPRNTRTLRCVECERLRMAAYRARNKK